MKSYQQGPHDIAQLETAIKKLNECKKDLEDKLLNVYTTKDEIETIKKELGDCWIPVNIAHRGDEIQNLNEKLAIMTDEFRDIQKADADFEGDAKSEQQITKLVNDLKQKLNKLSKEADNHQIYLDQEMIPLNVRDFRGKKNHLVIEKVRTFRHRIKDTRDNLADIKKLL